MLFWLLYWRCSGLHWPRGQIRCPARVFLTEKRAHVKVLDSSLRESLGSSISRNLGIARSLELGRKAVSPLLLGKICWGNRINALQNIFNNYQKKHNGILAKLGKYISANICIVLPHQRKSQNKPKIVVMSSLLSVHKILLQYVFFRDKLRNIKSEFCFRK